MNELKKEWMAQDAYVFDFVKYSILVCLIVVPFLYQNIVLGILSFCLVSGWVYLSSRELLPQIIDLFNINTLNAKYIDNLIEGLIDTKFINSETSKDDIQIYVSDRNNLEFKIVCKGSKMTEENLDKSIKDIVPRFKAVDYLITKEGNNSYIVEFISSSEIDILRSINSYPVWSRDIKKIPIGLDAFGNIKTIDIEENSILLSGIPSSGKSVLLTNLIANLCQIENERVIVISPKILDFAIYRDNVILISEINEAIKFLEWLKGDVEQRKQFCLENGKKRLAVGDFRSDLQHTTIIVDELAVYSMMVETDEKGKTVKVGQRFLDLLKLGVTEYRFAGIVYCLCLQKASSDLIPTSLRDLIAIKICFQQITRESYVMGLSNICDSPEFKMIPREAKGVGYLLSNDNFSPQLFKGFYMTEDEEVEFVRRLNSGVSDTDVINVSCPGPS